MIRAFGESAEHFAERMANVRGKKKSKADKCQRCGVTRKEHPESLGSCVGFVEASDCTCTFAHELRKHLHRACPFFGNEAAA